LDLKKFYTLQPSSNFPNSSGIRRRLTSSRAPPFNITSAAPPTRAAAGFGGGLDFRLTRLLSLRGEVRDLTSSPQVGFGGWHNLSTQFGFALHF